ncbi:hypothetical protein BLNAU_16531 [Blattamonas nauphoetae]|uniref:Uncharacterized protein n=1 Tax=Blattamonas nauphoetae TaxID=2049346 RepID=A0ABQ9XB44_9EUKA|nr:hypothetical protein BLNAU_16531 [Blattamonas nauphoetae]
MMGMDLSKNTMDTVSSTLGVFSQLKKPVLLAILGQLSPRILGTLLLTSKAFRDLVFSEDVCALQIQRIKDKARRERDNLGVGIKYDMFDSYDDKFSGDDCITLKRDGDVLDSFMAGDIEDAKPKSQQERWRVDLQERGRRCPHCQMCNVHAERGTKVVLEGGKAKYFHRHCFQEFVKKTFEERLSPPIIEKPFVLLAGVRGYESVKPLETYFTVTKQESKEEEDEDELEDWEKELEDEKEAQKEKENTKEMQENLHQSMNDAFKEFPQLLKDLDLQLTIPRPDGTTAKIVYVFFRKPLISKRTIVEEPEEEPSIQNIVDKSLRQIAHEQILNLVAPLCSVSSLRGDKRYEVKKDQDKNVKEIITKFEDAWNEAVMPRVRSLPSYAELPRLVTSQSFVTPFKNIGQPIFSK